MMCRRRKKLSLMLVSALALSWTLSGCAQGEWPNLGSVEKPKEAGAAGAPQRAAPVPQQAVAALPALSPAAGSPQAWPAQLAAVEKSLGQAWARYGERLDTALATRRADVLFAERWSDAQAALSRLNSALDELRALGGQAAAAADTPRMATQAGILVAEVSISMDRWQTRIMAEQNRLAVLTPGSAGAPGPNAVEPGERTAFAQINPGYPDDAFAGRLADGVRAVLTQVPGAAFDVVAAGDDAAAAQAAAQRVLWALRQAGVDYDRTAVALSAGGADAPSVAIYLRKTSL